MADVREEIFANVKTTLALILIASGYNFDVGYADIGLKHYTEIPADKFPAVMLAGADEERTNVTNTHFKSEMEMSIVGYVRSSSAHDPVVLERDLNKLIADVTEALYVDHTRGGHSTFTEITKVLTDKGAIQGHAMFEMLVSVEYRDAFAHP